MAIQVKCDVCGAVGEVPDDRAGQHGKCRCGNSIVVPELAAAGAPGLSQAPAGTPMQGAGVAAYTTPAGPYARPPAPYTQQAGPYAAGPIAGSSYQPAYDRRDGGPAVLSRRMRRPEASVPTDTMPGIVQVVRVLNLVALVLGGMVFCIFALAVLGGSGTAQINGRAADPASAMAVGLVFLLFMAAMLAVMAWQYWALGQGMPAAWTVALVFLVIGLLGFPIGTVLNGLILVSWVKPETKEWFGMA